MNKRKHKLTTGENIRKWREFRELKQDDLAKRLNITPGALSKIENGINDLNTRMLENIATELRVKVYQLLSSPQDFYADNNNENAIHNATLYSTQGANSLNGELLKKITELIGKLEKTG